MLNQGVRTGAAMRELFQERNYRLLWAGQAMALLGEQMNLIALPWLALQITGDAFALGSVLAVGGIPPAVLTLLGGVTTDRFSPRTIMLVSDTIRLALASLLVVLVLTGWITLWALYPISLAFGLLIAFSMPAAGSIVPLLVQDRNLQTANSLFQSLSQLAAFIGPAVAGILISAFGTPAVRNSAPGVGIAVAFGIYALGLLFSVVTLTLISSPPRPRSLTIRRESNALRSITGGLDYAWRDPLLRHLIVLILALNLLLAGPLAVGIPILSKMRLPEGAAAFGFIIAGFGGGNLIGNLLAGVVRRTKGVGVLLTALILSFGISLCVIGGIRSTWLAFLVLLLVGIGNGYLSIIIRTMLHRRTPRELLGRVMSLYFFAKAALVPISQATSGAVVEVSMEGLFLGAGGLLILVAVWLALSPAPRMFELQVEQVRQEAPAKPMS